MWRELFITCLMAFKVNCVKSKTPLTKCCTDNQVYMTELDLCREIKNGIWRNNHSQLVLAPPVHAVGRDTGRVFVEENSFQINYQLRPCPKGHVGMSSTDFMLYEDGSIHSLSDESTYNQEEFCIHESYSTGRLVARYCVPDMCSKIDVCIRKCCPIQTALNSSSTSCQNYTKPLNVTLYNQKGIPLTSHDPIFERDGVAPKCRPGYRLDIRNQSCYQLRAYGWLYLYNDPHCPPLPNQESYATEDYCVDHFSDQNGTVIIE